MPPLSTQFYLCSQYMYDVCACMHMCPCAMAPVWRSKDNLGYQSSHLVCDRVSLVFTAACTRLAGGSVSHLVKG